MTNDDIKKMDDTKRLILREAEVVYRAERRLVPSWASNKIQTSRNIDGLFRGQLTREMVEVFIVVAIDARNKIIGWSEVARGGVSACPVKPGDIFRFAILCGANGIICLHNHPSGDPTPSADDLSITDKIQKASWLIGIKLLDHVIIAEDGYYSFHDAGLVLAPKVGETE